MAKGISRKELKELRRPDEFVTFWTRAGEYTTRVAKERRSALVVGATMLVTVVIGSVVFSNIAERRATRATVALVRIEKLSTADLRPDGAPATNPDGTPVVDDGVPRFKTEKERDEAALKELDAFVAEGNPLKNEGLLERGPLLLALGRAPEAIDTYNQVLQGGVDPRLVFLAHEGLGYAQEQKGDLEAAAATFAKLDADAAALPGGDFYGDRALYHKARISELRGNADDAKKLYREVLDKNPTTSLRDEITNRLAVLELR